MTPGKKQAFEPTGLIPRSIVRTFERFYKQLLPRTKYSAIREYRISRYQVLVSIRCLCTLLILPLVTRIIANWLIFPQIQYFWDVAYQDEHVFSEIDQFSQVIFFDSLLDKNISCPTNLSLINITQENESFASLEKKELPLLGSSLLMNLPGDALPSAIACIEEPSSTMKSSMPKVKVMQAFACKPKARVSSKRGVSINLFASESLLTLPSINLPLFASERLPTLPFMKSSMSMLDDAYAEGDEIFDFCAEGKGIEDFTTKASSSSALPSMKSPMPSASSNAEGKSKPASESLIPFSQFTSSLLLPRSIIPNFIQPFMDQKSDCNNKIFNPGKASSLIRNCVVNVEYPKLNTQNKARQDKALQEKIFELAESSHSHALQSLTNVFADFLGILVLIFLLITLKPEITILKSFLVEVIYNLSDTTKSFLLILMTDLLVGFHSPRGWETMFSLILHHFGLPENQDFVFLFVATLPVILDTVFKYWIFRHLNKISPSTVATYHNMIE